VSPLSSVSQVSTEGCLSLAPPLAPPFMVRDGALSAPELELVKLYYVTLQRYYDASSGVVGDHGPVGAVQSEASVASVSTGRSRRSRRRKRKSASSGPVEDGYCYVGLLAPYAVAEAKSVLGRWPTLGRLMSLPLDMVRSVGELSVGMCAVEAGTVHVVSGCSGYSFKQVVQQAAVEYRTPIGTLGSAWVPCDSGLVVSHMSVVGGSVSGPGPMWDAGFGCGVGTDVGFSRELVEDAVYEPSVPVLESRMYGYRDYGEVTVVFCSVVAQSGIARCGVSLPVGCPVVAAYSLSSDGTRVFRYDCAGEGRALLNVDFGCGVSSRYFMYTVRSSDGPRALAGVASGSEVWVCDSWEFDNAVRDLDTARGQVVKSVAGLLDGEVDGWHVVLTEKDVTAVLFPVAGREPVVGLVRGGKLVGILPASMPSGGDVMRLLGGYAACPHGRTYGHCRRHVGFAAVYRSDLAWCDGAELSVIKSWSLMGALRALLRRVDDESLTTVGDCVQAGAV